MLQSTLHNVSAHRGVVGPWPDPVIGHRWLSAVRTPQCEHGHRAGTATARARPLCGHSRRTGTATARARPPCGHGHRTGMATTRARPPCGHGWPRLCLLTSRKAGGPARAFSTASAPFCPCRSTRSRFPVTQHVPCVGAGRTGAQCGPRTCRGADVSRPACGGGTSRSSFDAGPHGDLRVGSSCRST